MALLKINVLIKYIYKTTVLVSLVDHSHFVTYLIKLEVRKENKIGEEK